MENYIFTELQKKRLNSLSRYVKIWAIWLLLIGSWAFFAGISLLIRGGESIMHGRPLGQGCGFIVASIITILFAICNFKVSNRLKLVKGDNELNSVLNAIDSLFVLYKIKAILAILVSLNVAIAFLLWFIIASTR